MSRGASRSGGACHNFHIRRQLESRNAFERLQSAIVSSLSPGLLFITQPARLAHVTLMDSATIEWVTETSRRRHHLRPHIIAPRLRRAIPSSGETSIDAQVAEIRRLGKNGLTLGVVFRCPELDNEREAEYQSLGALGGLTLRRKSSPCHMTLGRSHEAIPQTIIDIAEQNAPQIFTFGAVLPSPTELAQKYSLPQAM